MVLISILTGVLVSACGVIGFVGLVIPHIVRSLVGADHKKLLPICILSGSIFLVIADTVARIHYTKFGNVYWNNNIISWCTIFCLYIN